MKHAATVMIVLSLAVAGCTSPYAAQMQRLDQDYQRGLISPADYNQQMYQLQSLDLQRRQAIAGSLQGASRPYSQPPVYRPTYGTGSSFNPSTGQSTHYNWRQY